MNSAGNKRKQAAKKQSKSEILLALSENPLVDLLNTSTKSNDGEINSTESLNSAENKRKQAAKKPSNSEILEGESKNLRLCYTAC